MGKNVNDIEKDNKKLYHIDLYYCNIYINTQVVNQNINCCYSK